MKNWTDDYIGLPFKTNGRDHDGVDCYGLICLAYKEIHNIVLPSFDNVFVDEDPKTLLEVARVMNRERDNWERANTLREFDMVQLRTGKHAFHVGLSIGRGKMIHVEKGIDAVIENLNSPIWRNRIEWIYRHKCLM